MLSNEKRLSESNSQSYGEKARCYGKQAAITIEATMIKESDTPTINIDLAPKLGESVSWDKKITVQLSQMELPIFASVLLGYLPSAEFKRSNKGISLTRQNEKIYVRATQGGNPLSLPIPMGNSFHIANLVLSQLKKQSIHDDANLLIAALKGSSALFRLPKQS